MPKYYSLLYIHYEDPTSCYVTNFLEVNDDVNIYDYLTNVYLNYIKTGDAGIFKKLCNRLDSMINNLKEYDEIDVTYENIYKWLEFDCSEDIDNGKIVVTKHQLDIIPTSW